MTFKEAYNEDLADVFFDPEEFASEHTIDGKPMVIVKENATLENPRTGLKTALNPKESAINKSQTVLYIQEKDAERKFTVNSMINLDGKKLFVYAVDHWDGVYRLTVGTHAV